MGNKLKALIVKYRSVAKDERGSVFFMMIFVLLAIFIFVVVLLEIYKFYIIKYDVETELSRLANNALEYNMDDEYRQEQILILDTDEATRYVIDNFLSYTNMPAVTDSGMKTGGPSGCRAYSYKKDDNGNYLYGISIKEIRTYAGEISEDSEPWLEIRGSYYIGPIIPNVITAMEYPYVIKSKNFRVDM